MTRAIKPTKANRIKQVKPIQMIDNKNIPLNSIGNPIFPKSLNHKK